jgi:Protein of Unknown function (DUF2784)
MYDMGVLASIVVLIHLAYFVFVVYGFVAIVIGAKLRWKWIRNPWFRIAHVLSVFIVLAEDAFGLNCPLNVAEASLRSPETDAVGSSGGTGNVLDLLLHHTLSERALDALYWTLGPTFILLLFIVRPNWRSSSSGRATL